MTRVCKTCGHYIEYMWWGEWVDEDDMAECYDEDTNYLGRHAPIEKTYG